jgi:hypothetical protein
MCLSQCDQPRPTTQSSISNTGFEGCDQSSPLQLGAVCFWSGKTLKLTDFVAQPRLKQSEDQSSHRFFPIHPEPNVFLQTSAFLIRVQPCLSVKSNGLPRCPKMLSANRRSTPLAQKRKGDPAKSRPITKSEVCQTGCKPTSV